MRKTLSLLIAVQSNAIRTNVKAKIYKMEPDSKC